MIEKKKTIETLEISGDMVIIRERIVIFEDGQEISHHFAQRNIKISEADKSLFDEKLAPYLSE